MSGEHVNVDNFARAESNRMFAALAQGAGGVGAWNHSRAPTPLDQQPVIRMNRDTLYSVAVVDLRQGAVLTIPDAGDRYLSVMVVNQNHYINQVFHAPGEHHLDMATFETPYVAVAARILVDPTDPADVAAVNALQDRLQLTAGAGAPFEPPVYDDASFTATRNALLELARGVSGFERAFGARNAVDPVRHLLGTAAGWGGLPEQEAQYVNAEPGLPVGEYRLTVRDVPVDAFWSISLYNAAGYFEPGVRHLNSVTAVPNEDGSITVNFGVSDADKPNYLSIMEGWNYIIRLYRPRPEILDGRWTFPTLEPAREEGMAH